MRTRMESETTKGRVGDISSRHNFFILVAISSIEKRLNPSKPQETNSPETCLFW